MVLIDCLLKIKDTIDFFSDSIFLLIEKLQPHFKKDVLFFIENIA